MNFRPTFSVLALLAAAALAHTPAHATSVPVPAGVAPQIERIEPPHWWVGMHDPHLQLMVHGPAIGSAQVTSDRADVRVEGLARSDNPRYLWVNLLIAPGAAPGPVRLTFTGPGGVSTRSYQLEARAPGSAQRQGFSNADVMLCLVPDRFANGDPRNDTLPGYPDAAKRSDLSGGRHGGDLAGIAQHLPDLAAMGYTMLWPTPVVENNMPAYSYHGYAATDLYAVDPRFGSNAQYRQLVADAGKQGIGFVQDIVLNHIGAKHWWLRDMPAADWLTHGGEFHPTAHDRTAIGDPYAAQVDRDDFTQGWFSDHMPDMNQRNPLVATYQIQNTLWWIEYAGLRGLRIDTYGYSDTAFLAAWSRRVMDEYPRLNMVGEEWSTQPVVVARWLRGTVNRDGYQSSMPSMMDFPLSDTLRHALVDPETYESGLRTLYAALANDNLYPQASNLVLFEGNHDMPRLFTAMKEDVAAWKMAMLYVATMPRIPQLYYGSDLLLTSPPRRDDGATRQDYPGGWPGDTVNGFTGQGLTPTQRDAQAWLRRLLTWRRTQPAIHQGRLMHFAPDRGSYVWVRSLKGHHVLAAINKSDAALSLPLARFREAVRPGVQAREVFGGAVRRLDDKLDLPARSVLLLEWDDPAP